MYPWTLDRNLLRQHWISWFEPCEIANLRPRADICNLTWLKVSAAFFELKSFLFEFYFFELYLFESSIGSMMINTISPGSRGSLAASRPATAALGPRFSHTAPAARRDCIYTTNLVRTKYSGFSVHCISTCDAMKKTPTKRQVWSVNHCHPARRKRKAIELGMSQSHCFRTWIETRAQWTCASNPLR